MRGLFARGGRAGPRSRQTDALGFVVMLAFALGLRRGSSLAFLGPTLTLRITVPLVIRFLKQSAESN